MKAINILQGKGNNPQENFLFMIIADIINLPKESRDVPLSFSHFIC